MKFSVPALIISLLAQAAVAKQPVRVEFDAKDDAMSCTVADVELLQSSFVPEQTDRKLQLGPRDRPCQDDCQYWPPGYCFYYFCLNNYAPGGRMLKGSVQNACDATVADLDSRFEQHFDNLTSGCQDLVATRTFTCLDE